MTERQSNWLEVLMKQYLLGIDIGTSACKIAVFEENGQVVVSGNHDYQVYYPKSGWAEQNTDEWWAAVKLWKRGA